MAQLHNVFHSSLLTPYTSKNVPHLRAINEEPPPILVDRDGPLYEVEDILDTKLIQNSRYYLIAWKGYTANNNTWEPEENLTDCQLLLQDF